MVTSAGRPSRGFCGACATVFRGSSPRLGLPSPPGFLRGSFSSESEVETEAQRGGENRPDPSVGVAAELERDGQWQLPAPPTWTDSKQRRREAIKKLAMGQKFSGDQHWEQTM